MGTVRDQGMSCGAHDACVRVHIPLPLTHGRLMCGVVRTCACMRVHPSVTIHYHPCYPLITHNTPLLGVF